ncbi:competence type IV pilus minor pilin ComGF [Lysinibacillus antri]|uniref:Competence protein ComGF n=1 Tax=Lysinibacillus antri TaxID=2498145 RepID=A0A3S0RY29_9BACI|nr:competence type IV pilus minor pilin ComGF [Lysinibacillus antri]RUL56958.1 hypothetical protein EK386_00620 [Lysinibacillus antri]
MYQSNWRNRINSKGYTFIEALFHFIVFALFLHLLIYTYSWINQMNNSLLNNEQVSWELFVQDIQQYFVDVKSLHLYKKKDEKIEIKYVDSNKIKQIQRYGDIIRLRTNDQGYVPLLIGIQSTDFSLNGNLLTITVKFTSGLERERTFYVPVFNE